LGQLPQPNLFVPDLFNNNFNKSYHRSMNASMIGKQQNTKDVEGNGLGVI
jgi:hypothetical protein